MKPCGRSVMLLPFPRRAISSMTVCSFSVNSNSRSVSLAYKLLVASQKGARQCHSTPDIASIDQPFAPSHTRLLERTSQQNKHTSTNRSNAIPQQNRTGKRKQRSQPSRLETLNAPAHHPAPLPPSIPFPRMLLSSAASPDGVSGLAGYVLVHRFDALCHGMLGQVAGQQQTAGEHDIAARQHLAPAVLTQQLGLATQTLCTQRRETVGRASREGTTVR